MLVFLNMSLAIPSVPIPLKILVWRGETFLSWSYSTAISGSKVTVKHQLNDLHEILEHIKPLKFCFCGANSATFNITAEQNKTVNIKRCICGCVHSNSFCKRMTVCISTCIVQSICINRDFSSC